MKRSLSILILIALGAVLLVFSYFYFFSNTKNNKTDNSSVTETIFPSIGTLRETIGNAIGLTKDAGKDKSETRPADFAGINSGLVREITGVPSPGFVISQNGTSTIFYLNNQKGTIEAVDIIDRARPTETVYKQVLSDVYQLAGNYDGQTAVILVAAANLEGKITKRLLEIPFPDKNRPVKTQTVAGFGSDLAISRENSQIVSIEGSGGKSILFESGGVLAAKKKISELPLSEWQLELLDNNLATLTTNPAPRVPGYLYLVNLGTGARARLLSGPFNLQTKMSPDAARILYSAGEADATGLYLIERASKTIIPIAAATFAEKCVWAADSAVIYCAVPKQKITGADLSTWHRGEISFSDKFIAINPTSGAVKDIFDPGITGNTLDALSLVYKSTGEIVFINKNNLHIYVLEIN